jgi:excisionase family DNA binding protein
MTRVNTPLPQRAPPAAATEDCSTIEVARRLGLAVRSVQLMVDRGELQAWKTPGGHRRIARASVDRWLAGRSSAGEAAVADTAAPGRAPAAGAARLGAGASQAAGGARAPQVLLIEDSRHFQNLVSMLVRQQFPGVELHLADDGIAGLAMAGRLQPDVLLVDLLLPGIDGATLIAGLRTHAAFGAMHLVVVTSLQDDELQPYAHALHGLPVVHKPRLVAELPARLNEALAGARAAAR